MKVTPYNKDHMARRIAEAAWKQPDDSVSNMMARVSEALISVGASFSQFRSLENLKDHRIPVADDGAESITYAQALRDSISIVERMDAAETA